VCDLATAIPVVLASLRGKQRACRNCNVVRPVDKAKFDERSKNIYIYIYIYIQKQEICAPEWVGVSA